MIFFVKIGGGAFILKCTVVHGVFWVLLEPLQGWVASDAVLLGDFAVDGGIDLGEGNVLEVGKGLGSLFVLRGKLFAVSAPRGVEFSQDVQQSSESK